MCRGFDGHNPLNVKKLNLMKFELSLIKLHWLLSSQIGLGPQRLLRSLPVFLRDWAVPRCESLRGMVIVIRSRLHVIEHFGLGRNGDPINPLGYQRRIANMAHI